MTADWTQGYVSDIEYLPGFYVEQTPAHLDVVCLLRGIEPPVRSGEAFRYCELGCGVGETATTIAAANPRSEVWGFDFNPAHIARARQLAKDGGLQNIRLEDASFEQLIEGKLPDLPQFDYITLHGVWSWVSAENRAHIVRFIDSYLKPGGLVYVSYNALPGWTSAVPLQRILSLSAARDNDRSDRRVMRALETAREFAAAGSTRIPEQLLQRLDKETSVAYLSHEYLNEHWAPCFHTDVASDLAAAKLNYVGSATLLENFPDLSLTAEQRELIGRLPPAIVETAKDYFLERTFRRDVFVRGARSIPERRLDNRIAEARLCLVVPPELVTREIDIPLGKASLNASFYQPALDALIAAPHTIGELMALPEASQSTATPREILGMLIGTRQAMMMPPHPCQQTSPDGVKAYNSVHLAACADEGRAVCTLAGAAIGSGVTARLFEMLAYEALAAGAPTDPEGLTNAVWSLLQSRGDRIRHDGEPIEDDGENLRILRENIDKIVAIALPLWRRVGAI